MVLGTCSKWHNMEDNNIEEITEYTKNKMENAIL
jgi:hypothetical protein